jgi:predicted GNAT family acetyltransferase
MTEEMRLSEGTPPTVEREDKPTGTGGVYRVRIRGHLAEMTFSRASDKLIIIDHTDVPADLRGERVGNMLLEKVIEDARTQGFKIFALCPFAAAQFRRHPEYRDVLST